MGLAKMVILVESATREILEVCFNTNCFFLNAEFLGTDNTECYNCDQDVVRCVDRQESNSVETQVYLSNITNKPMLRY